MKIETEPYAGDVDLNPLHEEFGEKVEEAGEIGFMLTYHVERTGKGVMTLTGGGIDQEMFVTLLRDALVANAEQGYTL